jgi:dCMP deaminase
VSVRGATLYCDTYPCYGCAKSMVSAGIVKVIFEADYVNDPLVEQLSKETGIVVFRAGTPR